jgi:hypothetical protein
MDWGSLMFFVVAVYALVAVAFAAAFYAVAVCLDQHDHLLGDVPARLSLAETCFWFSITNVVTVGYGNIVRGCR